MTTKFHDEYARYRDGLSMLQLAEAEVRKTRTAVTEAEEKRVQILAEAEAAAQATLDAVKERVEAEEALAQSQYASAIGVLRKRRAFVRPFSDQLPRLLASELNGSAPRCQEEENL